MAVTRDSSHVPEQNLPPNIVAKYPLGTEVPLVQTGATEYMQVSQGGGLPHPVQVMERVSQLDSLLGTAMAMVCV